MDAIMLMVNVFHVEPHSNLIQKMKVVKLMDA